MACIYEVICNECNNSLEILSVKLDSGFDLIVSVSECETCIEAKEIEMQKTIDETQNELEEMESQKDDKIAALEGEVSALEEENNNLECEVEELKEALKSVENYDRTYGYRTRG